MDYSLFYIQGNDNIDIRTKKILKVQDLVTIVGDKSIIDDINSIDVIDISQHDKDYVVVPIINIIKIIRKKYPNINFQVVGKEEILLRINRTLNNPNKLTEIIKVVAVCVLLFFGGALAITHFHADVNMAQAHSDIYKLITGENVEKPTLLHIAYSIGLGLGMTIFFYQIVPRNVTDEPNPLDIELYSYKKSMEDYILNKQKEDEKWCE